MTNFALFSNTCVWFTLFALAGSDFVHGRVPIPVLCVIAFMLALSGAALVRRVAIDKEDEE